MLKVFAYLKPFLFSFVPAIAFLFVQAFCDLTLPNYMAAIVNVGIQEGRHDYIFSTGLIMLGVALLGGLATIAVSLLSSRVGAGFARNLRKAVFEKIERFSSIEFDQFSTASLITRCTNDVTQIQMLLMMGIRMICYAPIMAIGSIVMTLRLALSLTWIIGLASAVLIAMSVVIMAIAMPKFTIIQKLVDRINLVSREGLSGLMVIRAFGTQAHEQQRFEKANDELTSTQLFINRVMVFLWPAMTLIMNTVTLLIIWIGAREIAASIMQVGDMMAFMQYAMHILMSFLMISMMFVWVPRALVSAKRINEVLVTENAIVDPARPQAFEPVKGLLEFRQVRFRYKNAEEDALSDISFSAKPGETTAIIGSTGSGKTTLVNLILRFYEVSGGQVLVDGRDVRDVTQSDLRARIGYVPQKAVLLSGSIDSNLRYGKQDATEAELERAAQIAQAIEFIDTNSERFNAEIAQGGGNVSGGQRQRLSIARAMVKQPEFLIFDDSFSALDFKTDSLLRAALREHARGTTLIIVAQRVNTIMNAEQIIVLDNGRIVGRGTHRELLQNCPEYHEIASSQLSEEELDERHTATK
ncbi:MAG: ABC transporter ATP-binding protein/permease [Treponema sp.]|nr:ABC transporter ATP-binding protein/permease [Treponema sp.]